MIPEVQWNPTPLSELPSWAGAKRVCIDLETCDPTLKTLGPGVRRGGYVCGIGFAIEDGPRHYLPIRHSGDNYDEAQVWRYVRDNAALLRGKVGGANFAYDLDYLWEAGVEFPQIEGYWDIQVNAPLLDDQHMSYSVDSIAEREGLPGKDRSVLDEALAAWGVGRHEMHKVPGRFAHQYVVQDLELPLLICRRQERKIHEDDVDGRNLSQVWALEHRLLPVLVKMRRRGVRVSEERLEAFEQLTLRDQRAAMDEIYRLTNVRLAMDDIDKKGPQVKVLNAIGVRTEDIPKTPGGANAAPQPKIDKAYLAALKHPVCDQLLKARKMSKLRSTFVDGIRRHLVKGRIHSTMNQLRMSKDDSGEDEDGARYGRISSTDPNMQQQPNPDKDPEYAKPWRQIYLPEEGMEWFANDYSQQEPRMLIHFAEVCRLPMAYEAAERFRNDPTTDNHTLFAQLIAGMPADWVPPKKKRSEAKITYLGLIYRMGGAKLARALGLPSTFKFIERLNKTIEIAGPEAQAILDSFHRGAPFVKALAELCEDAVRKKGFVRTLMGRCCRFPENPVEFRKDAKDTFLHLHKALNRVIQGSSADQTKLATCIADENGHFVQLQVHDELDGSCRDRKEAEEIGDIMRHCVKLRVPSKVDVECGSSWGGVE